MAALNVKKIIMVVLSNILLYFNSSLFVAHLKYIKHKLGEDKEDGIL